MLVTSLGVKNPKDVVAVLRIEAKISELDEIRKLIKQNLPYHRFVTAFEEVIDDANRTFTAFGESDD
jgi:hypothetical protein